MHDLKKDILNASNRQQEWKHVGAERGFMLIRNRLLAGVSVFSLAFMLISCGGGSSSSSATASANQIPSELRDYPYCEVVPNTIANGIITEHVFNTLKYGPCSSTQFATVTEQNIIDAYNASYPGNSTSATINGPRAWVVDTLTATGGVTTSDQSLVVNGIEFSLTGIVSRPVGSPALGSDPYVPYTVNRNTIYLFKAGTLVYELTDPSGNVYVMQSYSKQIDPNLRLSMLPYIGPTNQLAAGWTYSSRRLSADLTLTAAGSTTIVNDYYANTYQINPNR